MIEDVDSFLDGRLPELSGGRTSRLPAWAWISALAHGGRDVLEGMSAPRGGERAVGSWPRAIGFLAGEALDLAGHRDDDLRELQQQVLVPAELDFLDQAARGWTPGPEQFAASVLATLEEQRRAGPRPAP